MFLNKYAYGKYQVIDRELHKKEWVKTKDLKLKKAISDKSVVSPESSISSSIMTLR
jgi:hypothetical protein